MTDTVVSAVVKKTFTNPSLLVALPEQAVLCGDESEQCRQARRMCSWTRRLKIHQDFAHFGNGDLVLGISKFESGSGFLQVTVRRAGAIIEEEEDLSTTDKVV